MPITAKSLSAQAMQLPPEERLALVDELLDTLDVPDASLDALWGKEAESRLTAYRRGEIQAVSLSDVIAKYQASSKAAGTAFACWRRPRPSQTRPSAGMHRKRQDWAMASFWRCSAVCS